jgi:hypothetical protein
MCLRFPCPPRAVFLATRQQLTSGSASRSWGDSQSGPCGSEGGSCMTALTSMPGSMSIRVEGGP